MVHFSKLTIVYYMIVQEVLFTSVANRHRPKLGVHAAFCQQEEQLASRRLVGQFWRWLGRSC